MAHEPNACSRETIAAICFDTHARDYECHNASINYTTAVDLASYHRSTLDGVSDDNEQHEPFIVPSFRLPEQPNFTFNSKRPLADDDIIPLLPYNTDTTIDSQHRPRQRQRIRYLSDQANQVLRRNELRNALSPELRHRVPDSRDQLDLNTAMDVDSGTNAVTGL